MQRHRRMIGYALREWRPLLLILLLTAAASLLAAVQPWPLKILFDWALGSVPPPPRVAAWLAPAGELRPLAMAGLAAVAGLVVFAVQSALDAAQTWVWSAAGQRMVYDLAGDAFDRIQRLSLSYHSRRSVGDAISRITGDAWCLQTFADCVLIAPLQHALTLLTVGAVAWRLDAGLAAITLAIAPLMAVATVVFGRHLKRRGKANREAQSKLMSFVHQTITAIPVVSAFGAERRGRRQFRHLAETAIAASQRQTVARSAYGIVTGLIATSGTAVLLYLGGRRVLAHELPLGSLIVLVGYLRSLQGAAQGLIGIHASLKGVEASSDRILEILDCPERVAEPAEPLPLPEPVRGQVRIEHVTFGYEPGRPVLNDVTIEAEPGETIALVGATGAGKSTLAALIPRLYDPWQGRVLLDGVDLRRLGTRELRRQTAVVLQEPFLLPLSVSRNIAYGRPDAKPDEIVAAAVAAQADAFIRDLPQGYRTVIGERGATLSGGQRQRLAIARALLRDARVLILDEPTAALDPATEAQVMAAVERLMRGRTTFLIAHRLSTARRADRIVVLDAGRVVEAGPHDRLMAAGGPYRRLYETQFGAQPGGDAR